MRDVKLPRPIGCNGAGQFDSSQRQVEVKEESSARLKVFGQTSGEKNKVALKLPLSHGDNKPFRVGSKHFFLPVPVF